ncbi:MAG: alanine racemase, partial [Ruminococcaceae bacterium]|nr:alanine racemase [Oscillospiraceae bacterium]
MEHLRVCVRISKDAIIHNINQIKKLVPPNTKLMPVIKADGYGHGAFNMASVLENSADYFAVAIIEEALEL